MPFIMLTVLCSVKDKAKQTNDEMLFCHKNKRAINTTTRIKSPDNDTVWKKSHRRVNFEWFHSYKTLENTDQSIATTNGVVATCGEQTQRETAGGDWVGWVCSLSWLSNDFMGHMDVTIHKWHILSTLFIAWQSYLNKVILKICMEIWEISLANGLKTARKRGIPPHGRGQKRSLGGGIEGWEYGGG